MLTTDREYRQAKLIRQGKKEILPEFKELAKWIDNKYGVTTLNIIYDTFKNVEKKKTPRIRICFEHSRDMSKFQDANYRYDEEKQKSISKKFEELISNQELLIKEGISSSINQSKSGKYRSKGLHVCFSFFEPTARQEVQEQITEEEIKQLKEEI